MTKSRLAKGRPKTVSNMLTRWFSETDYKVVSDRLDEILHRWPLLMRAREQVFQVAVREAPVEDSDCERE